MGKNLKQQRRGRGTAVFRALSRKSVGRIQHVKNLNQNISGNVIDLLKCPMHYAPVAQIKYNNGEDGFIFAPEGMKVGDDIQVGTDVEMKPGNSTELKNIPEGTLIYNIESQPGDGGKFCRTNGTFARVVAKLPGSVTIILPSKKEKKFCPSCRANIGIICGSGRKEKPFLKAGNKHYAMRARNKFWPVVNGNSMNAVAHPFGGGSSHRHKCPRQSSRDAPPGRKVGSISPSRTGKKR